MSDNITIEVYRRLDNRAEGLSDDSPRALELHNRRKEALHEVFDADTNIQIRDWGHTDNPRPHELIEIILTAAASATFQYAIVPGVKWLGNKLVEQAVDTTLSELAKYIVAKLRPKQEEEKVLDFTINLPDGTAITVDPPDRDSSITIHFSGGSVQSLNYSNSTEEEAD